jgi:hypothetical protein
MSETRANDLGTTEARTAPLPQPPVPVAGLDRLRGLVIVMMALDRDVHAILSISIGALSWIGH